MPKGQSPKIKGLVCNALVEIMDVSTLVIIKLKRKPECRGHTFTLNQYVHTLF